MSGVLISLLLAVAWFSTEASATFCAQPPTLSNGWHNGHTARYRLGHVIIYSCNRDYHLVGDRRLMCRYSWFQRQVYWSGELPVCESAGSYEAEIEGSRSHSRSESDSDPKSGSHDSSNSKSSKCLGSRSSDSTKSSTSKSSRSSDTTKSSMSKSSDSTKSSSMSSASTKSSMSKSSDSSTSRSSRSSDSTKSSRSKSSRSKSSKCLYFKFSKSKSPRRLDSKPSKSSFSKTKSSKCSGPKSSKSIPDTTTSTPDITTPVLPPRKCPYLLKPYNGYVDQIPRLGSYAYYKCKKGYVLSGNAYRKCSLNATWTGKEPKCLPSRYYYHQYHKYMI